MTPEVQIGLTQLLSALRTDLSGLCEHVTARIEQDEQDYDDAVLGHDELLTLVTDNIAALLDAMSGISYSLEPARRTGRLKAERGIPLDSLLHAFRVAGLAIWEFAVRHARGEDQPGLTHVSTSVWATVDEFSLAAAEEHRRHAALDGQRPSQLLLRAVLDPHLPVAQREVLGVKMRLPAGATFAILVGDVRLSAGEATIITTRIDDEQVTLVAVSSPAMLERTLNAVTTRGGASRRFTDLRSAPTALEQARFALRCAAPSEHGVHTYATSPVRALLAADPGRTADVLSETLAALDRLPSDDAEALVQTAVAWCELGGSTSVVGGHLHLHRNTVLHRLKRIEGVTGKAFAEPADAALLYLTLQAWLLNTDRRDVDDERRPPVDQR